MEEMNQQDYASGPVDAKMQDGEVWLKTADILAILENVGEWVAADDLIGCIEMTKSCFAEAH